MFSAVGDQLATLGIIPSDKASYADVRHAAADYIESHPDDFIPFLPSLEGEDMAGATDSGLMSPKEFKEYCAKVRDTAVWGGEPEIVALSKAYNVPIHVIQGATPHIVVHSPSDAPQADESRVVRISYHRRMYGLGEVSGLGARSQDKSLIMPITALQFASSEAYAVEWNQGDLQLFAALIASTLYLSFAMYAYIETCCRPRTRYLDPKVLSLN